MTSQKQRRTLAERCFDLYRRFGDNVLGVIACGLNDDEFEDFVLRCLEAGLMCIGKPPINTTGEYPFLI